MQPVNCPFGPGLVGIISGDLARYHEFNTSLMQVLIPKGSTWKWVRGNGIAANRNLIAKDLEPQHEWVWFMDDDQVFEPDILMRLLQHDKDIVQPLVVTRKPPYRAYAYYWNQEKGMYDTTPWEKLPTSGLIRVDGTSAGGMLVKKHVFEKMKRPWFEEGMFPESDMLGEDLWFSKKAMELGIETYLDLDTPMGHMSTHAVWPGQAQGKWCVDLDVNHGVRVRVNTDIGKNALTDE